MRISIRIFTIPLFFAFATNLSNCADVSVYECPCNEQLNCKSSTDISTDKTWTKLTYETFVEHVSVTHTVSVRLKQGSSHCGKKEPSEKIVVSFVHPANTAEVEELEGMSDRTNETVYLSINESGLLSLFYPEREGQFNRESYCIRRLNTTHSSVEICCGRDDNSCLRKCCPYGYVYDLENSCVEQPTAGWNLPSIISTSQGKEAKQNDDGITRKMIRTGFPECHTTIHNISAFLSTSLAKFNFPRQPYRLYEDGTVTFLAGDRKSFETKWKTKTDSADYCVDTLMIPDDKKDLTCGNDEQDVLILCTRLHVKKIASNDWVYRIVYMTGFSVSIVFLVITAIVHFLLWEKQNIHAWTILLYVLTLTGFYSCLLIIYVEETRKRWSKSYTPFISKELCFGLGIVTHFMGIFSFSWLSVINFDLWWTFRVLQPMNQRKFDIKRLLCYAGFAVAVPTAVVSVAGTLQISYDQRSEPSCRKTEEDQTIYPMYGEDGCFLANSSQPYYFYLPVGVLLLANLIFYMCTSCQMLRIYNATRQISSRNSRKQKQSCELFLKLFLVMGTTWIFQVILAIVENDEHKWYSPIFLVVDLVNMFQAVAIFLIFVCKRETLRALEHKYVCLKSCLLPFRGVYQTQTIISRSTDGSTRMSRAELTKHSSIDSNGSGDYRRDSELINFS